MFEDLVARMDDVIMSSKFVSDVIYTPAAGGAVTIKGIFDENYVLAKGDPDAGVEVLGPAVFLRKSDLPTDPDVDDPILTIGGVNYRVVERRPDSLNGIVLVLRRVT